MTKSTVKHNRFKAFLSSAQKKDIPNLVFIFGESFLVKQTFKAICAFILGKDKNQFALELLEGGQVSMGDIIEQISTFSFLVSKKVVAVKNIPLFQNLQNNTDINFSASDHDRLADFIGKGIPKNYYLILTSSMIDKRKKIYKAMAENGLIIDCSVAKGARKADQDEQKKILKTIAEKILSTSGKSMDNQALHTLVNMTGFNLDIFSQNIEKLIAYSGRAKIISTADVKAVVKRDKKDPIFALTNAVIDKDVNKALFYVNSLFNEGFHPLQILKSFENIIRKLIQVKCFTQKFYDDDKMNLKKINFHSFKQNVLPKVIHYDEQVKTKMEYREKYLCDENIKKKANKANDLFLAPNPHNAYPVFQTFHKSGKFVLTELNQALIFLGDLDYKLKSSSIDAKTQIENFIIKMCCKGGFHHDTKKY